MSYSEFDESTAIDGNLSHIITREIYGLDQGSDAPANRLNLTDFQETNSADSSPLSEFEIDDIVASEHEFASGQGTTYASAEDFIRALHASRERYKREAKR